MLLKRRIASVYDKIQLLSAGLSANNDCKLLIVLTSQLDEWRRGHLVAIDKCAHAHIFRQ